MKKIYIIVNIFLVILLSACSLDLGEIFKDDEVERKTVIVKYFVDNELYHQYIKYYDQEVYIPKTPEKENYIFEGWFDSNDSKLDTRRLYDEDTIFNAKFTLDFITINNKIQTKIISSNVKINLYVYDLGFLGWSHTNQEYSSGSGVIIDIIDGYYVVLTNAHVTNNRGRSQSIIDVIDYKGNAYKAYKIENSENLDYDLSLIYFQKSTLSYHVIEMEMANPKLEDLVISIGQPGGQNNTVTYGEVIRYTRLTEYKDDSLFTPPKFDVIRHNAPTGGGSSGGVILNDKLKLIGINFAGSTGEDGSFIAGYSIPVIKIREYLTKFSNVYN